MWVILKARAAQAYEQSKVIYVNHVQHMYMHRIPLDQDMKPSVQTRELLQWYPFKFEHVSGASQLVWPVWFLPYQYFPWK